MAAKTLSKRELIKLALSALASSTVLFGCDSTQKNSRQANQKLLDQLRHHGVAAHLGRLYQQNQTERGTISKEILVNEMLQEIGLTPELVSTDDIEKIPDLLATKIRQDFVHERVIPLDGWLLSKTEARICALIYRNINPASG